MNKNYDEVITLGRCCEPCFVIRHFKLSNLSYPFDWATVPSINGLCEVLKSDFKPYYDMKMNVSEEFYPDQYLHAGNTKVGFPHGDIEMTKHKKIDNFRKMLLSGKRILFVIKSHLERNVTLEEADKIVKTLQELPSNITFKLLIVNEYTSEDTIIDDYSNPHVIVCNIFGVNSNINSNYDTKYIVHCDINTNPQYYKTWKGILDI